MGEIRLAKQKDIEELKRIWKLCFGDSDAYRDFYFANRYREEETVVLEYHQKVVAMATMLPVKTVTASSHSFDSVMFYAIATDPHYQQRGFATQLMQFCNEYLHANYIDFSMLVPEDQELFEFYRRQGYQESFGIQEVAHSSASIALQLVPQVLNEASPFSLTPAQPEAYNRRRNLHLQGRLHIAYNDGDILYQKKLSQASEGDIYLMESDEATGCVVAEFISPSKLLIKELLIDEKWIPRAMQEISGALQARTYIFRIPSYMNTPWIQTIRPLGMMKKHREVDVDISCEQRGYIGLAFD